MFLQTTREQCERVSVVEKSCVCVCAVLMVRVIKVDSSILEHWCGTEEVNYQTSAQEPATCTSLLNVTQISFS